MPWFDVLVGDNLPRTLRHLPIHLPTDLVVRESCGGLIQNRLFRKIGEGLVPLSKD